MRALLHSGPRLTRRRQRAHAQFDRVLDALSEKLPRVSEHLDTARTDVLAFTGFPKELWRQIWSNNPSERLNRKIRRRTDVVGIFDLDSLTRLVGVVLAGQYDEWPEGRSYLGLGVLARSRVAAVPDTATNSSEGVTSTDMISALKDRPISKITRESSHTMPADLTYQCALLPLMSPSFALRDDTQRSTD
ncbi:hypothetical protein GCM10023175_41330 [Pseudonocardia xishanensis]|uniref:Mutator family transposase n=1 Tax=Pseudonocardia xishanensis TaxID=630995 RepID=A0ABP8RV76_9PSEU